MSSHENPISPLRQRMIEDMRLRKLGPRTQSGYIRAVKKFTRFLGRSPDTADAEDAHRLPALVLEERVGVGGIDPSHHGVNRASVTRSEIGIRGRPCPLRSGGPWRAARANRADP